MDVFAFYRNLLFLLLTVYAAAMTASMLWQSGWLFFSPDRSAAIIRKYLLLLVLRMQLGPFKSEVLQILLLGAAFLGLVWLHTLYPLP